MMMGNMGSGMGMGNMPGMTGGMGGFNGNMDWAMNGVGHIGTMGTAGYGLTGFLTTLLLVAFKLLALLLVAGVIVGLLVWAKKYLLDNQWISFSNSQNACPNCHNTVQSGFNFCPHCKTALKDNTKESFGGIGTEPSVNI